MTEQIETVEDEGPQYEHECSQCRFERRGYVNESAVDVYTCPAELMGPSMVVRFSSEEDEYWSMPVTLVDRVTDDDSQTDTLALARQVLAERDNHAQRRVEKQKAYQKAQYLQEQAKLVSEMKKKEEMTDAK